MPDWTMDPEIEESWIGPESGVRINRVRGGFMKEPPGTPDQDWHCVVCERPFTPKVRSYTASGHCPGCQRMYAAMAKIAQAMLGESDPVVALGMAMALSPSDEDLETWVAEFKR
jgi:hypothetical protein